MEVVSNIVLYVVLGLVALAAIASLTFVILPPEKLEGYKEVIISIVQRTPEVKVEVNQPYETK